MKLKFTLLLVFIFSVNYSQEKSLTGIVNYEERYGNDGLPFKYELQFCNHESFYERFFDSNDGKEIQTLNGFLEPEIKNNYYTNLKTKKLLFQEGIAFKSIIIEEDPIVMEWKIEDETIMISNYLCQKATINFKKNNYIAWFTSEIPVSFGPWKFNGLPGLILECYDVGNNYLIKATKISLLKECNELKNNSLKITSVKPINMKKYIELRNSENEDIYNFYQSKGARDSYLEIQTDYSGFNREPLN